MAVGSRGVAAEDHFPVPASRCHPELGDQEPDDVREADRAGRDVHLGEGDRLLPAAERDRADAVREVEVGERDGAAADGVPVEGQQLALVGVEDAVPVGDEPGVERPPWGVAGDAALEVDVE